ncbi:TylF/MycF family methyltransferase [Helicobacter kayseriensis]|uniref:TylF/MycF family methyltransferase n=1 Tax=Helicobacter kayseriensis TaxID=2905877 RepID=UPI001E5A5AF7|nr:TylF/MycF family methyltransferase [Helicobacter kayseriensis]MCE3046682.1 TylF/MycF family methyltransferase [Helicobacter kayseriensis]MCE3048016.1 TylF/MycF family methyltransferase [Helicobacter kayseriensis]
MIKNTKGSIIECGVHWGGGIMAFAKLCAGFDILGNDRKVIGFDTFEGFPHLNENDQKSIIHQELKVGGFQSFAKIEDELQDCIEEFNRDILLPQYKKIQLIKGDACLTIPEYITNNPHTIISLLYLDFDLYEPTKVALEYLAPRVIKGGIIAFDELNDENWPGETIATLEYFKNFNNCKIQRFEFASNISYMVIE